MCLFQFIAIIIGLGSIVWAFFSPAWAWIPLVVAAVFLLLTILALKQKNWRYVEELSPSANEMVQKYGHYYFMPFAGRDFSSAASTIQFAGAAVGIIGAIKGFYWGIAIALVFWCVIGWVAMGFNPTQFLKGTDLTDVQDAHEEVISWVTRQWELRVEARQEGGASDADKSRR